MFALDEPFYHSAERLMNVSNPLIRDSPQKITCKYSGDVEGWKMNGGGGGSWRSQKPGYFNLRK